MGLVHLGQDLRFGWRRLRRTPLFTITVAATLSLAIAANVAVFSAVSAILLRPLPIQAPERVLFVAETIADRGQTVKEVSYRNFVDWRAQTRAFEAMAAIGSGPRQFLIDRAGTLLRFKGAIVSGSFFALLGASPRLGRALTPADDVRGAARVLVLSDRFWRQQFGADSDAIGTQVTIASEAFTIVGVMPPDFAYPAGADAWTPVVPALAKANVGSKIDPLEARNDGLLFGVGRLRPGVTAEQARAELDVIARRLPESHLAAQSGSAVIVTPLLDQLFGPTRRGLVLLFAMVCFVLLIACANVSSLVLARAASLRDAFALKSALGASRARLVREWVVELAIVTSASTAIGVALAWIGLAPLLAMAPSSLPRIEHARIDLPVLAFAIGLCLIVTLLCAIVPALQACARGARDALRRSRSGEGPPPLIGRGLLTAVQVAFAMVLLTVAGLLVRSFDQLRQIDLGFRPAQVVTFDVEPQTRTAAEYRLAYDAIIERVAALPSVEAVGAVLQRPLAHGPAGVDSGYLLEGQRIDRPESWKDNVTLNFQSVTPGYFDAMQLTLRRGRVFSARDSAAAPGVAVVSESTARRLWPGKDPIGQRLSIASGVTEAGEYPLQTVVGVVADVRDRGIDDRRFDIYMTVAQTQHGVRHLMVRTAGDPIAVTRAVQSAIAGMKPRTLVEYHGTMGGIVADAVAPWRFSMTLLVGLAALGATLAAAGLFALVAYAVDQRAQELAVRLAIGAAPDRILRMVLWQGGRFAAAGLAAGILLSLAISNRVSPLLFQVPARDLSTFAVAAGLLGTATFFASYLAARRVIAIDPAITMRAQ